MNRFFVEPSAIEGDRVLFDAQQSHQLVHVLRLPNSAEVTVLDNLGWEYRVQLSDTAARTVAGQVLSRQRAGGEPGLSLTLFQGYLKRDKFEWVLQKGTEVGISGFVPVVTERSLVRKAEMKASRLGRWQSIVREAAEQCQRGRIPQIREPVSFARSCQERRDFAVGLIASTEVHATPLHQALQQRPRGDGRAALWVGPEGGFSAAELQLARSAGLIAVSLGPRVLRTETAAVVGAALWLYQWDLLDSTKE